jgi:uncharacterized protein YggU (UPF0235/DUF167 family)
VAVPPALRPHRLTVRVTPKGGRDAVEGWTLDEGGRPLLKVRVAAAASDGAANAAVVRLVARTLKVARSAVRIAAGETARVKRLEIEGVTEADVSSALGTPPAVKC